jgi:photosystem II stability/assembly factor-like uncharacterized protein
MIDVEHVEAKSGDVLVLAGTAKGLFMLRGNPGRSVWEVGGPYFDGHAVNAVAYDGRAGRRRLWAATQSMHWGAVLRSSDDVGRTWTNPEAANVKFPEATKQALANIWQIALGADDDTLYAGVQPAALFASRDGGATWSLVDGLWEHPHREKWEPGGGGLCLHTIVVDGDRLVVAISTGGVYRSDDAGKTWRAASKGVRAEFMPEGQRLPEFGQCVHKVVRHPAKPDTLFLQNHWGLYRSDDGATSWKDIANGVPSDFGFGMAIHPTKPDTVYILPLESDGFRVAAEAKLRVFRTRDAGATWEGMTKGLPQTRAFETVLRDALTTDACDPAGVYFGTRSGKLYASRDEGDSWNKVIDGLPAILCVKTAVL